MHAFPESGHFVLLVYKLILAIPYNLTTAAAGRQPPAEKFDSFNATRSTFHQTKQHCQAKTRRRNMAKNYSHLVVPTMGWNLIGGAF